MLEAKKHIILQRENTPVQEIRFSPRAKLITVALLVGLLLVYFLNVWEALPPFIWAAVTAFIFNGLLKRLCARFGGPRWAWAAGIYLAFLAILVIALLLIIPAISREAKVLATDSPHIKQTVDDYLNNNPTISIIGIEVQSDTLRNSLNSVLERIPQLAQDLGPGLVSKTFHFAIDLLLYLIATFYLMLIGGRAIWQFVGTLPLNLRSEIRRLVTRADTVLGAYIKGQFLLVLIMSVASFIFLSVMGIRYALTLGIMTGVLELIPFVGPYLAITVCSLVAFFQPHGANISFGLDSVTLVIVVIIGLFILRQMEDLVVIPNVIGRIVELPPLLVIFTTITAAALLGPMGLLLGVPMVAVTKIIVCYLYYKLVDADRQKLFLTSEVTLEELVATLQDFEPNTRLLIIVPPGPPDVEFFDDPEALEQLKTLSREKALDLAFNFREDEKTAHRVKEAGFPIITMSQEHFFANNWR
jgi:predicted PurR-regulated permease PerM